MYLISTKPQIRIKSVAWHSADPNRNYLTAPDHLQVNSKMRSSFNLIVIALMATVPVVTAAAHQAIVTPFVETVARRNFDPKHCHVKGNGDTIVCEYVLLKKLY